MRRTFTKDFKLQAVKLVLQEDISVKNVSQTLEISNNTLYRWISEYEANGDSAFPGEGSREFLRQNEIRMLEKENKRLREELDVLKKFRIFLKNPLE